MNEDISRIDLANAIGLTERAQMINWALLYVRANQIPGDYYEFGVGRTLLNAMHFAEKHQMKDLKFFGFDSFEGLPRPQNIDDNGIFKEGDYKHTQEEIEKLIPERFKSRTTLVKGWYDDLYKLKHEGLCSIAWVDCDLYWSTRPVLNFLDKYMVTGAVIIFDDWFTFRGDPTCGENAAFNLFLRQKCWKAYEFRKFSWHGNSFIVRRVIH